MNSRIRKLLSEIDDKNLREYVRNIEGLRHGSWNYDELEKRAIYIEDCFKRLGYTVEYDELIFSGRRYRNIIATLDGMDSEKEWILLGAHYDSAVESPGADDNASGVSVMLETARILKNEGIRNLKFVAFTLEEPQAYTSGFLIGSKNFVNSMKKMGMRYRGVFILESVGYISRERGSQSKPFFVRAPDTGDFLGVIGNRSSSELMRLFITSVKDSVPELRFVPYTTPLNGYLIIETRFSDHSPFWDAGYQALMLTDTAMFRNPHYHTPHDTSDTLDYGFMKLVTASVISVLFNLSMPFRMSS